MLIKGHLDKKKSSLHDAISNRFTKDQIDIKLPLLLLHLIFAQTPELPLSKNKEEKNL